MPDHMLSSLPDRRQFLTVSAAMLPTIAVAAPDPGFTVVDAVERQQQPAGVPVGAVDHEDPVGPLDRQDGAVREALVGLIGARLDGDLAADTVRPPDTTDDDAHEA